MTNTPRRNVGVFVLAGTSLVLGLASLVLAVHNATPAGQSCPITGIVKCLPSPGAHTTAAFITQPFTWVGAALVIIALVTTIVGAIRRGRPSS